MENRPKHDQIAFAKAVFVPDNATCTLILSDIQNCDDVELTTTVNKGNLIVKSTYFAGVFGYLESNTLKIKVPHANNFIECIVPVLNEEEASFEKMSDADHIYESFSNTAFLGFHELKQELILMFAANIDVYANDSKFNSDHINGAELRTLLKYEPEKKQSENENNLMLHRIQILLKWLNRSEENFSRTRKLFNEVVDFSKCTYDANFSNGIADLRKKYPNLFYQYVSCPSLFNLFEIALKKEWYYVDATSDQVNGIYHPTKYRWNDAIIYHKKATESCSSEMVMYYEENRWIIASCLDISNPHSSMTRCFSKSTESEASRQNIPTNWCGFHAPLNVIKIQY